MKKISIVLVLLLSLIAREKVFAQMEATQKTTWDVNVSTGVKAYKGSVWRFLNDNEMLQRYSNGYVKSVKRISKEPQVSREIVFSNGNKRSESIVQADYVHKFMVIRICKASLPKGIKNAEIAIFTADIDDDNSNIQWKAKIEGSKSKKENFIKQLKAEFSAYAKGFGNI
jgi:hypothetical protein